MIFSVGFYPRQPSFNNWRNIAITLVTPQLRGSGNSAATQKLANNGLWKITPDKSAAVYESFPFIWPYNARSVEVGSPNSPEVAFEEVWNIIPSAVRSA
jgi:hypothetical protein